MNIVSLVLISHSDSIVYGLKELLQQVEPDVSIAIAGGFEEGIGTDVFEIKEAIESVYTNTGVVVLFDLGSALLNAEMAIEMLEQKEQIRLADAPLIEGAYAALVEAGCGGSLDEVVKAAESVKHFKKIQ
jgi:phosphoenolpyruvate---glycerone phosphotransferase subunit DhaM